MTKLEAAAVIVALGLSALLVSGKAGWRSTESNPAKGRYLTSEIRAAYPGFVGQDVELGDATDRLNVENQQSDEAFRAKNYRERGVALTKIELDAEGTWRSVPKGECGTFGKGSAPQLCLQVEGPATRKFGMPVAYRIRWRNLPGNAYIRVWVVNAAPAGERWRYMGPQGSIAVQAVGGSPAGDARATWDGRSNTCAPADLPMLCDNGQIGSYVLRAAIVTGGDPFHVGWPERNPQPTRYLAGSETQSLVLEGQPSGLQSMEPFSTAIAKALPQGVRGRDFSLNNFGPWRKTWLSYCSRLDLGSPLAGAIEVCFPRVRIDRYGVAIHPDDDIVIKSDARLATGIMNLDDAKARAIAYGISMAGKATFPAYPGEQDLVRVLYRNPKAYNGHYQDLRDAARDAGLNYIDVDQAHVTFQDDAVGSWWLAEFSLRIQTIDGPVKADLGRVKLRIDHDGQVCRVSPMARGPGENGLSPPRYSGCLPATRKRIVL